MYIHHSIIYNGEDMETTWVSIDRQLDKEDVVHVRDGILLSQKKEWNLVICDNMDGPSG